MVASTSRRRHGAGIDLLSSKYISLITVRNREAGPPITMNC